MSKKLCEVNAVCVRLKIFDSHKLAEMKALLFDDLMLLHLVWSGKFLFPEEICVAC